MDIRMKKASDSFLEMKFGRRLLYLLNTLLDSCDKEHCDSLPVTTSLPGYVMQTLYTLT